MYLSLALQDCCIITLPGTQGTRLSTLVTNTTSHPVLNVFGFCGETYTPWTGAQAIYIDFVGHQLVESLNPGAHLKHGMQYALGGDVECCGEPTSGLDPVQGPLPMRILHVCEGIGYGDWIWGLGRLMVQCHIILAGKVHTEEVCPTMIPPLTVTNRACRGPCSKACIQSMISIRHWHCTSFSMEW